VARGEVKYIILPEPGPLHLNAFDYNFDPAKYVLEKVIDGYLIYRLKTNTSSTPVRPGESELSA
jgi:hypothetical protein